MVKGRRIFLVEIMNRKGEVYAEVECYENRDKE
jgi:hypothetical protein